MLGMKRGTLVPVRRWLLAFTALASIVGGSVACQAADEALDTTRLPRLEGAKELFAFPATTAYVAPDTVARAAEAAGKLLAADGWLQYAAPVSASAEHPEFDIKEFRKGHQALSVSVQRAPAQGNATAVTYTVTAFRDDLPAPKRAPAAPSTAEGKQDKPADVLVDISRLPRLDGAKEEPNSSSHQFIYSAPGSVPSTVAAIKKLFAAEGWKQYETPSEEPRATSVRLKKGPQGVSVSFSTKGEQNNQSIVYYVAERLYLALPFPAAATDIVFDQYRPYLSCITAGTIDANLDFFQKELGALGWSPLSATDAAARWSNANIDKVENGARVYYVGKDQQPILLLLQRRADDKITVEIKVPPFAEPQDLEAGQEMFGLPVPKINKTALGRDGTIRKELKALVPAEIDPVLVFYRRELAKHNWKEEAKGAVLNPDEAALTFSSAEGTATLKLGHKYDLTTVSLVTQVPEAVAAAAAAAKAKAQKEATDKFLKEAQEQVRAVVAASEAKRAAAGPEGPLHPLAGATTPVPLPETAENVEFDGADGKLEFNSSSSVKALAAFYRAVMKPLGWKEQPSVINGPNLVELDFSKGGKELTFTAIRLGDKVNVHAHGSGLVAAVAKAGPAGNPGMAPAKMTELEAAEDSGLPVPKQHTLSAPGTWKAPGGQSPFRRELDARVPAELGAVLAFYHGELAKRQWKEAAKGAVVMPDKVVLAFSSPEGPAVLKLGRQGGETTVNLALKNPAEAAKAGVLPAPGQVKLMFGNLGSTEAAITINTKTIKIAAGTGGPTSPNGPTLELPPGKYKYSLKIAGRPARTSELEVGADDTWGLMVPPGGDAVLPLQMY